MIEKLLDKQILDKVSRRFSAQGFTSEFVEIRVNKAVFQQELDLNASYFIVSDKLDIPLSANLKIASDANFINVSKTAFEYSKYRNPDSFEGAEIRITTENYGASFTAFSLVFLKITPYNP